jgi:hypothetical protein
MERIVPWVGFALVLVLIVVFGAVLIVGEVVKLATRNWREQP